MEEKEMDIDKKSTLEWFLHKRFITIGFIMGILMILCSGIIIKMSFMIRNIYRELGDDSKGWVAVAGIHECDSGRSKEYGRNGFCPCRGCVYAVW